MSSPAQTQPKSDTPTKETLFPTIGSVANQTDRLEAREDDEPLSLATKKGDAKGDERREDGEEEKKAVQEIESLCMKCGEQGTTRLLLTSIPFFREIVVMSFRCEHCGDTNNEIQAAGEIRASGTLYTAKLLSRADLNRQIIRSSSCSIQIPEWDLTLPPTARGQLTTVEGLLRDVVADLSMDQPLRRVQDPGTWEKIEELVGKIKDVLGVEDDESDVQKVKDLEDIPMRAITLKLDDPSGNSFIEFIGSMADPKWNLKTYQRTLEQNITLGLVSADEAQAQQDKGSSDVPVTDDEIFVFTGLCSSCGHSIQTNMKKVNIPYFKDIIIMSTNCERCGYRDNEVKSGSAISEKGKKITLKVEDKDDLSRDILKSETAAVTIPEIDLELTHGTLGGRFTTLEGILEQVYEELSVKVIASGDSSEESDRKKFVTFLRGLKECITASKPYTLILDDPLANSYIQNLYAPDEDPNLAVEWYPRTWEQDEELGLNDIKVEGYEVVLEAVKEGEGEVKDAAKGEDN